MQAYEFNNKCTCHTTFMWHIHQQQPSTTPSTTPSCMLTNPNIFSHIHMPDFNLHTLRVHAIASRGTSHNNNNYNMISNYSCHTKAYSSLTMANTITVLTCF